MSDRHWLCMDCGKNTLEGSDYYMLRNKLWRMLVPREQRHGMLCLACVERRLGCPLLPTDFRGSGEDESQGDEGPMTRADYGIIDSLGSEKLHAIDAVALLLASAQPRSVGSIVRSAMESPAAVPGLPDWFYIERIEKMVDSGQLAVVEASATFLQCRVRSTQSS